MASLDSEIRWVHTETCRVLSDVVLHTLNTESSRPGKVRVAGIRPAGSDSTWQCFETGQFEAPDDDNGDGIEWRLGWGPPGCIERLPEFEGW